MILNSSLIWVVEIGLKGAVQSISPMADFHGKLTRWPAFRAGRTIENKDGCMRLALVVLCVFGLAGCSLELRPVEYDRPVNYKTAKDGSLQLINYPAGESLDELFDASRENAAFKYSDLGVRSVSFDVLDERVFAESIAAELTRKGLVSINRVSDQVDKTKYLSVQLVFTKKKFENYWGPNSTVEMALQLTTPASKIRKVYKTSSFENSSTWDRMNVNAVDSKELLAKNLMNKIIPDIETFLQMDLTE